MDIDNIPATTKGDILPVIRYTISISIPVLTSPWVQRNLTIFINLFPGFLFFFVLDNWFMEMNLSLWTSLCDAEDYPSFRVVNAITQGGKLALQMFFNVAHRLLAPPLQRGVIFYCSTSSSIPFKRLCATCLFLNESSYLISSSFKVSPFKWAMNVSSINWLFWNLT